MFSDSKLSFNEHLKTILRKTNETIEALRKLQTFLLRPPVITIYKSLRPYLDYRDMIHDPIFNMSFRQNNGNHSV